MAALFTALDYRAGLQRLMPRGRAWPQDPDSIQAQVLLGLAGSLERVDAAAQFLLTDAFPTTTVGLLPEWEASLGLPDPCAGDEPSLPQRRNQVVARFTAAGGQSPLDLIDYAARLGFAIDIRTYAPLRCGVGGCGDPLYDEDAAHTFAVIAPETTVTEFQCGVSGCGDPLGGFGNDVLECEMTAIAPAHTVVIFQYTA